MWCAHRAASLVIPALGTCLPSAASVQDHCHISPSIKSLTLLRCRLSVPDERLGVTWARCATLAAHIDAAEDERKKDATPFRNNSVGTTAGLAKLLPHGDVGCRFSELNNFRGHRVLRVSTTRAVAAINAADGSPDTILSRLLRRRATALPVCFVASASDDQCGRTS